MKLLALVALTAILAAGAGAWAADAPGKPMKVDEPMHGEMKKESMKKGDVKKAAKKKERELKPMLKKEAAGSTKK